MVKMTTQTDIGDPVTMKEEQLDLFAGPNINTVAPDIGDSQPTMGYLACPWCVGLADVGSLQSRTPPAFKGCENCGRCYGAGCIEVPVRVANGFWWHEQGRAVIEAANEQKAKRKAGGQTAVVFPLRVDAGGYSS